MHDTIEAEAHDRFEAPAPLAGGHEAAATNPLLDAIGGMAGGVSDAAQEARAELFSHFAETPHRRRRHGHGGNEEKRNQNVVGNIVDLRIDGASTQVIIDKGQNRGVYEGQPIHFVQGGSILAEFQADTVRSRETFTSVPMTKTKVKQHIMEDAKCVFLGGLED